MSKELKCEICGKPALGVVSSSLGAISHAYCRECLDAGRDVWSTLVGGLYGTGRGHAAEWVQPIIDATCEFYNKTEDQLWEEVTQMGKDFEEYCNTCAKYEEQQEKEKVANDL